MYSCGWSGTHCEEQVRLKIRESPVSASQVLKLKVWSHMPAWMMAVLDPKGNWTTVPSCCSQGGHYGSRDARKKVTLS